VTGWKRRWIIVAALALPLAWLFWTGSDAYVVSRSRAIRLGQTFEQVEALMSGVHRMVMTIPPNVDHAGARINFGGSKIGEYLTHRINQWRQKGYSIPGRVVQVQFGRDGRVAWIRRGEDTEGTQVEFPRPRRKIFREAMGGPVGER
jgi:hypothetical protein